MAAEGGEGGRQEHEERGCVGGALAACGRLRWLSGSRLSGHRRHGGGGADWDLRMLTACPVAREKVMRAVVSAVLPAGDGSARNEDGGVICGTGGVCVSLNALADLCADRHT